MITASPERGLGCAYDVMISYARADHALAEVLAREMSALGLRIWWDEHLYPGDVFSIEIEGAIESARWTVVLWSAASAQSTWVRAEATVARKLNGDRYLPLTLGDVTAPMEFIGASHIRFDPDTPFVAQAGWVKLIKAISRDHGIARRLTATVQAGPSTQFSDGFIERCFDTAAFGIDVDCSMVRVNQAVGQLASVFGKDAEGPIRAGFYAYGTLAAVVCSNAWLVAASFFPAQTRRNGYVSVDPSTLLKCARKYQRLGDFQISNLRDALADAAPFAGPEQGLIEFRPLNVMQSRLSLPTVDYPLPVGLHENFIEIAKIRVDDLRTAFKKLMTRVRNDMSFRYPGLFYRMRPEDAVIEFATTDGAIVCVVRPQAILNKSHTVEGFIAPEAIDAWLRMAPRFGGWCLMQSSGARVRFDLPSGLLISTHLYGTSPKFEDYLQQKEDSGVILSAAEFRSEILRCAALNRGAHPRNLVSLTCDTGERGPLNLSFPIGDVLMESALEVLYHRGPSFRVSLRLDHLKSLAEGLGEGGHVEIELCELKLIPFLRFRLSAETTATWLIVASKK